MALELPAELRINLFFGVALAARSETTGSDFNAAAYIERMKSIRNLAFSCEFYSEAWSAIYGNPNILEKFLKIAIGVSFYRPVVELTELEWALKGKVVSEDSLNSCLQFLQDILSTHMLIMHWVVDADQRSSWYKPQRRQAEFIYIFAIFSLSTKDNYWHSPLRRSGSFSSQDRDKKFSDLALLKSQTFGWSSPQKYPWWNEFLMLELRVFVANWKFEVKSVLVRLSNMKVFNYREGGERLRWHLGWLLCPPADSQAEQWRRLGAMGAYSARPTGVGLSPLSNRRLVLQARYTYESSILKATVAFARYTRAQFGQRGFAHEFEHRLVAAMLDGWKQGGFNGTLSSPQASIGITPSGFFPFIGTLL